MSTVTVQTISNGTISTSTANVINGAKSWVNFNGLSGASPVIRASYNVSSVTRTAVGSYTINFTNAFVDANYAANAISADAGQTVTANAYNTTNIALKVNTPTVGDFDSQFISLTIFR